MAAAVVPLSGACMRLGRTRLRQAVLRWCLDGAARSRDVATMAALRRQRRLTKGQRGHAKFVRQSQRAAAGQISVAVTRARD
uniref:Uncharacterized protein n=1 Tax=Arundo donax TaxID=35708 RepID=A0A0A9B5N9_ARUDO